MRTARRQFRTKPLAVGKMLEVEGKVDREPSASRPGVVRAAPQGCVGITFVRLEFHSAKLAPQAREGHG